MNQRKLFTDLAPEEAAEEAEHPERYGECEYQPCGRTFRRIRKTKKHCSPACKQAAYRERNPETKKASPMPEYIPWSFDVVDRQAGEYITVRDKYGNLIKPHTHKIEALRTALEDEAMRRGRAIELVNTRRQVTWTITPDRAGVAWR